MTDERLRQLEREAATGDVEARAKLLLERVRVGDLTEERLRLAAELGNESAGSALSMASLPPSPIRNPEIWENPGDNKDLFKDGLRNMDSRERLAFACDCATRALRIWELYYPTVRSPAEILQIARGVLTGEASPQMARAAAAVADFSSHEGQPVWNRAASLAGQAAWGAANSAANLDNVEISNDNAAYAASMAAHAAAAASDAYVEGPVWLDPAEREWQSARLAVYLLGEAG